MGVAATFCSTLVEVARACVDSRNDSRVTVQLPSCRRLDQNPEFASQAVDPRLGDSALIERFSPAGAS